MSRLLQNRIMKAPSKVFMAQEQAFDILCASYLAEVRFRNRDIVLTEELVSQLQSVVFWLTDRQTNPWLLLCGSCGNGKSTMVKALRQFFKLIPLYDPRDNIPMTLIMTDAKTISSLCRTENNLYIEFMKKPMLAIDDLGIEPQEIQLFGNICTPLVDLLTDRYEEQRITIITTNLTPAQIRDHYGDRIADRLNEMAEKIIFRNATYRCEAKKNECVTK